MAEGPSEALAPLDERDRAAAELLREADCVDVPLPVETVEIRVHERRVGLELVHEGERRARDDLVRVESERPRHVTDERRLASAERALEQEHVARAERRGERLREARAAVLVAHVAVHARRLTHDARFVEDSRSIADGPMLRPSMSRLLALFAAASLASLVVATTARADRYALRAELDLAQHVVRGEAHITFTNTSAAAIDHLVLHLYMNAFESEDTVFMRESRGRMRGVHSRSRGSIAITSLRTGDHDLLAGADDELVPNDRTQLRVTLPSPLRPGDAIVLDARFVTRLPKVFARSGHAGDFHAVAQWFPKLAKLERDGHFASFPYHGHGEFYADFAHYDLTVVTPRDVVVGATGTLAETHTLADGRVERTYVADRVHDVAFVASPELRVVERTCARVHVHLLHPPGYEPVVRTHMDATCSALAWMSATYGAYPYTDLTVVVPPRGADGAAGMEYPTLFLTAGEWLDLDVLGLDEARETTVHELVHQWFQGLVATNEVRWPFLDEGITSYVSGDLLASYAPHAADARAEVLRAFATRKPSPGSHAAAFTEGRYGSSVYVRSQMILETVARTWGRERVRATLGDYARAQRFRHPTPSTLFAVFDAHYWPGFARDVLEPLFMKGETLRARVGVVDGRLVAERHGLRSVPLDVLHVAPDGVRTLRRFGGADRLVFGPGCVTIDPFHKSMLDDRRGDDHVCTRGARARRGYVERLAALLAAFVGGAP